MIVTCERCATQFQLDDAKVKGDGIRVRCSRCKHAFFVKSPNRPADEEADEVERLVRAAVEENEVMASALPDSQKPDPDAVSDPRPDGTPESAARVGATPEPGSAPEISATPESSSAPEPAQPATVDLSEADWQFNDDSHAALDLAETFEADDSHSDPFAGGETAFGDSGDDLGAEDAIGSALDADIEPLPETDVPATADPQTDVPAFAVAGGDLGDPQTWNLPEPPAPESIAAPAHLERAPASSRVAADGSESTPAAEPTAVRETSTDTDRAELRFRRGHQILGWSALGVLCLATLCGGLGFGSIGPSAPPLLVASGFAVETTDSRWIENAHGGWLYVVEGTLRRAGPPGSATTVPVFRGFDRVGSPLPEMWAVVAPPVSDSRIREVDSDTLASEARLVAHLRPWSQLQPGESRRFQALFQSAPSEEMWLKLEAVDVTELESPVSASAAPDADLEPDPAASREGVIPRAENPSPEAGPEPPGPDFAAAQGV